MEEIIKDICNKKLHLFSYKVSEVKGGLNNHNFLIENSEKKYIIRIPFEKNEFDRYTEEKIHHLCAANITPKCVYFDANSGIKVTEYIEDAKTLHFHSDQKITKAAALIRTFHDSDKCGQLFYPSKLLNKYRSKISGTYFSDLDQYEFLINFAKKEEVKDLKLCHNDLVEGNFLFTTNKAYLIDFEFACDNNYLFDLASFISENQLNHNETELFLTTYFQNTNIPYKKINQWVAFNNLLWCYWSLMMYEQEQKDSYLEIAQTKYNQLKKA